MPHTKTKLQEAIELATGMPVEKAIRVALRDTGSKVGAARRLGNITRTTLDEWIDQYRINWRAEAARFFAEKVA